MEIAKVIWRLETCLMCDDCTTCDEHDRAIEEAIKLIQENQELKKANAQQHEKLMAVQHYIKRLEEQLNAC